MNLIIVGSANKNSDTVTVARELSPVPDCEIIDLIDHHVDHYNYVGKYSAQDSFMEIAEKMRAADNIVFATPVYWYAMSGHMKVFFDRMTCLMDHVSPIGRELKGKNTYLIVTGYGPEMPEGFEVPFRDTSAYFGMNFKGTQYKCTK